MGPRSLHGSNGASVAGISLLLKAVASWLRRSAGLANPSLFIWCCNNNIRGGSWKPTHPHFSLSTQRDVSPIILCAPYPRACVRETKNHIRELRQTANVNHVTKFSLNLCLFTVHYFYAKISSFTSVLTVTIVMDCF